jgi:hypothetical protein
MEAIVPDQPTRNVKLVLDTSRAVRQGRKVTATIGIDKYDHLPALKNAVKDANGVAALFRDRMASCP